MSEKEQFMQEITDFFDWYKSTYGVDISLDGELDLSADFTAQAPDKEEIQVEKTSFVPAAQTGGTFAEKLIHQGHPELKTFYQAINQCSKCGLHKGRTHFVFGMGNPQADLMFIGEAPGRDEDLQGLPFVGKAGQLLDKMLFALKLKREDVYIANVLKCRPPNNRDPLPDEVLHCEPYLKKQIEIIKPRVMIALGRIAAQVLLKKTDALSVLRQSDQTYEDIPFIVTYHPAALLRNPGWKSKAWQDLQKIGRFL